MSIKGGNGQGKPLLEDLLEFPCRYEIKVMGLSSTRFEAVVHAIIGEHIARDELLATTQRHSRNGKYVSLTCIIRAHGREQLERIYTALRSCPEVLMTL
jgi:hypothetical protein